jgi:hypothetical protein
MWPSLLLAYADEAGIARGLPTAELPSRAAALAFVINGDRAVADARRTATVVRIDTHAPFAKAENESGVFAGTGSDRRGWSHKSFVGRAELSATPMESAGLRALADNLVDTTVGRLAPGAEVQQLASWLAEMSCDPQAAMRQAAAARIIEPRPAVVAAYNSAPHRSATVLPIPKWRCSHLRCAPCWAGSSFLFWRRVCAGSAQPCTPRCCSFARPALGWRPQ